jgi:CBS domain-containing protein
MSAADQLRIVAPTADPEMEPDSVTSLFHRLNRVVPEEQQLLSVPHDMKAADAIRLMTERGFSQVPVLMGTTVFGVFSFRSFARAVLKFGKGSSAPEDLLVEECVEDPEFAQVNDEFPPWFDHLDRADFILLGGPERLQAIVTPMDLLRYLYNVAYPFVLLSEIEQALRRLIRRCVNESELVEIAARNKIPSTIENMVFKNYLTIITEEVSWPKFQRIFGGARARVETTLDSIRRLRNDVFHFKRELTERDRDELQDYRNWILRRARVAEVQPKGGAQ